MAATGPSKVPVKPGHRDTSQYPALHKPSPPPNDQESEACGEASRASPRDVIPT